MFVSLILYFVVFIFELILNKEILSYVNVSFKDHDYLIYFTILISCLFSLNLVLRNLLISIKKSRSVLHSNIIEGISIFILLTIGAVYGKLQLLIYAYGFTQLIIMVFIIYKLKLFVFNINYYKTLSFNKFTYIPSKSYKLASGDFLWSFLNFLFMSLIAKVSLSSLGNFHIANQIAMAVSFHTNCNTTCTYFAF